MIDLLSNGCTHMFQNDNMDATMIPLIWWNIPIIPGGSLGMVPLNPNHTIKSPFVQGNDKYLVKRFDIGV